MLSSATPLPQNRMPKYWDEEERMKSLLGPFRNKAVNPEDWNSKYKFWNQLIKDWASYNAMCSFSLIDLNMNFKRKGVTPLCLPTILLELIRNKEVVPQHDFVKTPSYTWTGWTINTFIKGPISWSFSKVKDYISEPVITTDASYVHVATVKELAEIILSTIDRDRENTLLSISELTNECIKKSGNDRITESNIKLALIYLKHSGKASFRETREGMDNLLIKVSPAVVEQVTEIDESLHRLGKQEDMLIKNLEQLELEKKDVIKKAKTALNNGLREVSKSHLRKKHEIDKTIEKRSSALFNVQMLLSRIHDARSATNTLQAYKVGYNVLKKYEDIGLIESTVQDTMDNIHEIFEELQGVQTVMAQSVVSTVSDDELDKELSEIICEDAEQKDELFGKFDKLNISVQLPNLDELNLQDLPLPKPSMDSPSQSSVKSVKTAISNFKCEK